MTTTRRTQMQYQNKSSDEMSVNIAWRIISTTRKYMRERAEGKHLPRNARIELIKAVELLQTELQYEDD